MDNRNVRAFFVSLVAMVLIVSCSTNTVTSTPALTSERETLSPSATSSPTLTLTHTSVLTRTPSPTRNPTRTPYPTLSPDARRDVFGTILNIDAECDLPCWWDITPGETTWEDALVLWRGFEPRIGGKTGYVTYATLDFPKQCPDCGTGHIEMWGRGGVVMGLLIEGTLYDETQVYTGILSDYLTRLQLADIVARYGAPSQVYADGTSGAYYDTLWVEYAEQGLLFSYAVDTVVEDVALPVCPVAEGSPHIAIVIQPPDADFHNYREYVRLMDEYAFYEGDWKVVEGLSPEAFVAAFRDPSAPNCLWVIQPASEYLTPLLPDKFDAIFRPAEDAHLLKLLATNGGCELPCWWGITPGITRIEDVRSLFAGYGKAIGVWDWGDTVLRYEVGLFARHDPAPLDYVVRQSFYVRDDIVSHIHISGEAPLKPGGDGPYPSVRWLNGVPVLACTHYLTQDWQRYSLASTLDRFGVPSQVLVHYTRPDCYDSYQLGVVYDDAGVLMQYGGKVQYQDDKILICPTPEEVTRFGLVLAAPGSGVDLAEEMRGCSPGCAPVSLEEAAGIRPGEFYKTYMNPAATACFEVLEEMGTWCP